MKKQLLTALWLASAVLLAAAGLGCMLNPGDVMSMMADWVGVVMVFSGLMQLAVVWLMRKSVFGDRSFFTKAVVAVIVGVFIMCKSFIAGEVLRVLISMMVLVDAVSILGAAWAMNSDHVLGRGWLWLIGLVELVLGVCGFLRPELVNVAVSIIMGVSLIYEGLTLVYTWFIGMRWRKALGK
ncbi:MAG: DUF308 domain-containing protein [Clostridia bacterium]|nr:DUF308 domain-containing protein [Clostridia bacterium]